MFEYGIFYKKQVREVIIFLDFFFVFLVILIFYPNCSESASNVTKALQEIKTTKFNNVARNESLWSWIISRVNAKSLFWKTRHFRKE